MTRKGESLHLSDHLLLVQLGLGILRAVGLDWSNHALREYRRRTIETHYIILTQNAHYILVSGSLVGGQDFFGFLAEELLSNPVNDFGSMASPVVLFDRSILYDTEEEVGEVVPETPIQYEPLRRVQRSVDAMEVSV